MTKFRSWNEEDGFTYFDNGCYYDGDGGSFGKNLHSDRYNETEIFWQNAEQGTIIFNGFEPLECLESYVGDKLEINVTCDSCTDTQEDTLITGVLKHDNFGFYLEEENEDKSYLCDLKIIYCNCIGNIHENKE